MPETPMKSGVIGVHNSRPQFASIGAIELRTPIEDGLRRFDGKSCSGLNTRQRAIRFAKINLLKALSNWP
jgi:hypothetical protein